MTRGFFVTGTDTGVGKTRVACALIRTLCRVPGRRVAGMKPVASGVIAGARGTHNPDALLVRAASNVEASYDEVNPCLFPEATAPHLAAARAGAEISIALIATNFERLAARADCVVVEGAGGWCTPIGPGRTMADVAATLQLPVILVVGVRLGCLNHALLTAGAVVRGGLRLAGWVESRIDPDTDGVLAGYPEALGERLAAPRLGVFPYDPGGFAAIESKCASCLDQARIEEALGD